MIKVSIQRVITDGHGEYARGQRPYRDRYLLPVLGELLAPGLFDERDDAFDPMAWFHDDQHVLQERTQFLELLGADTRAVLFPHVTSPKNFQSSVRQASGLVTEQRQSSGVITEIGRAHV